MNAQQLKNAILQEAIEGRLVPQDPNDEPASVLLARIRKEKESLVKEGKLKKKDLEVKPISEDEIPFEIPESWEWVRMSSLIQLLSGQDFPPEKYNSNNKGVPYITGASNIENGKLVINRWTEFPSVIGRVGDLLIVCKGSGVGKMCISDIPIYHIARQIQIIRCFSSLVLLDYLKVNIDSNLSNIVANAQGVIPGISREHVLDLLLPLPPLAEQYRIVAKIEQLLPKVEEYGKAQDTLNKLNAELPERLKKSILQEAIEGLLVPQDPNDEPASLLLERIRKEKKQLVKEGKLKKKDLDETPISEDEILFAIPKNWMWCRLNDICIFLSRGKSPKYSDIPNDYPVFAQKCNLKEGGISLEYARFLSPETVSKWQEEYHLRSGDVLVNSTGTGTVCRTRLFHESCLGNYPFTVPDSHVSVVRSSDSIYSAFIFHLFNSKIYQDYWEDRLAGSTNQKELYIGVLQNTIIPLPPLAEQHRIVEKLEQLFGKIDKLKK